MTIELSRIIRLRCTQASAPASTFSFCLLPLLAAIAAFVSNMSLFDATASAFASPTDFFAADFAAAAACLLWCR